jgi:tripartite-type tricarboxylate transporter receptor subunit TctC
VDSWYSLHAPAGTPQTVVSRIHRAIVEVLDAPDIRERLRTLVSTPGGMEPAAFGAYVKDEYARYGQIIRLTGTRID